MSAVVSEGNHGLGRRGMRAALEARHVYVQKTIGQCRHTRRNNLRVAYAANRRAATIARLAALWTKHARAQLEAMKLTEDERKVVKATRGDAKRLTGLKVAA